MEPQRVSPLKLWGGWVFWIVPVNHCPAELLQKVVKGALYSFCVRGFVVCMSVISVFHLAVILPVGGALCERTGFFGVRLVYFCCFGLIQLVQPGLLFPPAALIV